MTRPAPTAAMFDLDGTLLDTIVDLANSMNAAVEAEGLPTTPIAEHNFMVGEGVDTYIRRAIPEGRRDDDALRQRVRTTYRDLYSRDWAENTRPYEGIDAMLTELAERGIRLTVLSNKPDGSTREMVAHFLGAHPFEIVRGAVDGVPLKPDPAAALAIAGQMDIPPEQFLYLGDTATDMRTATAAGMFAVGCLWGFRPRAELEAAGAAALIEHPGDFLRFA